MRAPLANGTQVTLDNGQHIMIGAYSETLALMKLVGVDEDKALLRLPLTLVFPDGKGITLPRLPAPLDAVVGILNAQGWDARDKLTLLRTAAGWQWHAFRCNAAATVAQLCRPLTPRVMAELIEPLCVSALNIPAARASGQVFLRVIRDSLFAASRGSNLLLPRTDLSAMFPLPAADWLQARGASVLTGERVEALHRIFINVFVFLKSLIEFMLHYSIPPLNLVILDIKQRLTIIRPKKAIAIDVALTFFYYFIRS